MPTGSAVVPYGAECVMLQGAAWLLDFDHRFGVLKTKHYFENCTRFRLQATGWVGWGAHSHLGSHSLV